MLLLLVEVEDTHRISFESKLLVLVRVNQLAHTHTPIALLNVFELENLLGNWHRIHILTRVALVYCTMHITR